jgi:hypothetical protein
MPDLAKEATEYLTGERAPFRLTVDELARLIFLEATHNRMWAQATMPQWEAAINEAIKTGLIESRNGKLGVVSEVEEAKPQQMGLFE